jgi:hypothetical protein
MGKEKKLKNMGQSFKVSHENENTKREYPTISLAQEFTKVDGLGKETLIALAVKGINSPELMVRRVGMSGVEVKGELRPLYEPIRKLGPSAPIFLAQAQHLANPGKRLWEILGTESRDIIFRNDIAVAVMSQHLIVIDAITGHEVKRIHHPEFKLLHTVEFHPDEAQSDIVLVSSSGVDRILEVNIKTDQIVYNWFAWDHGFNKNHFGMTLIEKGKPLPPAHEDTLILTTDEYIERFKGKTFGDLKSSQNIFILVDTLGGDADLGLENVFHTVHPNWAGYSEDGTRILATLLLTDQAIEIDRATGNARVVLNDLSKPHGLVAFLGGYLVSDSRHGRVLHVDQNYNVLTEYHFSDLAFENGDNFSTEWIQFTHLINDGELIATVDSRRAMVIIWNSRTKEYSTYPYEPKWLVQAALPVPIDCFNRYNALR